MPFNPGMVQRRARGCPISCPREQQAPPRCLLQSHIPALLCLEEPSCHLTPPFPPTASHPESQSPAVPTQLFVLLAGFAEVNRCADLLNIIPLTPSTDGCLQGQTEACEMPSFRLLPSLPPVVG